MSMSNTQYNTIKTKKLIMQILHYIFFGNSQNNFTSEIN